MLPSLDTLGLVSEMRVFDGITKPSRVVTAAQVVQPSLFVDPLRNLGEYIQILGSEIVTVARTTEIEAVIAHIALSVPAAMTNASKARWDDPHRYCQLVRLGLSSHLRKIGLPPLHRISDTRHLRPDVECSIAEPTVMPGFQQVAAYNEHSTG